MKRVFISEVDTHLGIEIAALFKKTTEYEVFGTVRNTSDEFAFITNQKPLPHNITKIVPSYRTGSKSFRVNLLSSDVIICLVRDDIMEAEAASKMLRNHPFEVEKTLVLVTSVLSWANTIKGRKANELKRKEKEREQRVADGEDPIDVDMDLGFSGNVEGDEEVEEKEPDIVYESEYADRIPHEAYQHFLDIERLAKQFNSETLHSHVVFAGLQYGLGEEAFHNAFMAAWHQRPVPIYSHGSNVVPMIHRSDLALLIFKIGSSYDVIDHRYILAVDRGNCTLGSVSETIAKKLGNVIGTIPFLCDASRTSVPVSKYDIKAANCGYDTVKEYSDVGEDTGGGSMKQLLPYYKNFFEMDLRMEGTNAVDILPEEEWVALNGFLSAFDRVANEFKVTHNLTPVRALVIGPPMCGKSTIAKDISRKYRVPHLTIESIIKSYKDNLSILLLEQKRHRRKMRQAQLNAEQEARETDAEVQDKVESEEDEEHDDAGDAVDDADTVSDIVYDNDGSHIVAARDDSINPHPTSHGADDEDGDDGEEHADIKADLDNEEVEEEEELVDDDDPDDEILAHLTETIARSQQVLSLQIREGRKLQENEDNEDVDEIELDDMEVPVFERPLPPGARLRYVDEALAAMARWRLQQSDCQNQGYVLDGFPKNTTQAYLTFRVNDDDLGPNNDISSTAFADCDIPTLDDVIGREVLLSEDPLLQAEEINSSVDDRLLPDTVVNLTCTDNLLTGKVNAEEPHTSMAALLRRIKVYRATHDPTKVSADSLISWVKSIKTAHILPSGHPCRDDEVTASRPRQINYLEVVAEGLITPKGYELGMSSIVTSVGPRRYRCPTVLDIKQQEAHAAHLSAFTAFQAKRAEEERVQEDEAEKMRNEREMIIHERRFRSMADEKKQAKIINAMPMETYLSTLAVPSIIKGISLVAEMRPNDPINSLADFLFEYKQRKEL